jgi:hypothetical protein
MIHEPNRQVVKEAIEQFLEIQDKVSYRDISEYCNRNIKYVVDVLVRNKELLDIHSCGDIVNMISRRSFVQVEVDTLFYEYKLYKINLDSNCISTGDSGMLVKLKIYDKLAFDDSGRICITDENIKLLRAAGLLDYEEYLDKMLKENLDRVNREWKE